MPLQRAGQRGTRLNSGEATNVGQVITWHPADALEQSEPSSRSRKTQRCPPIHPARCNLAYMSVPTRRVSEGSRAIATSRSVRDTSEVWRSHQRRPGHYLAPSRCFGTKRAVQPIAQDSAMSVHSPRQVQPGLHFCPNPTRQRGKTSSAFRSTFLREFW